MCVCIHVYSRFVNQLSGEERGGEGRPRPTQWELSLWHLLSAFCVLLALSLTADRLALSPLLLDLYLATIG